MPKGLDSGIRKVGVIGAGQMGSGIAHVAALSGFDVRLVDIADTALERSLGVIGGNMDRQLRRGLFDEAAKAEALARIGTGTDYAAFRDCDIVIEAATENEAVKREVFKALLPISPRAPSSPPTPPRSRSRGSPPPPTGRSGLSACIS